MKKVKLDICHNGVYYKSIYAIIEAITDVHGNVIKSIKPTDFLQIGCNLNQDICKYKNPCKCKPMEGIQDKPKSKPIAKKKVVKPTAKKPIKKVAKKSSVKKVESTPESLNY